MRPRNDARRTNNVFAELSTTGYRREHAEDSVFKFEVQQILKSLHSTDIGDVEKYLPEEEDKFGFTLRAIVGPMEGEGEESFDIVVCTPKWLTEKYTDSDVLLGIHKLIVFKYDPLRLRKFIEKYLMRCSGNTWEEVAQKFGLLGQ